MELRKSLDTRAARWSFAVLVLLAVYQIVDGADPTTAARFFATSWQVLWMLLPVLGVLSVTDE